MSGVLKPLCCCDGGIDPPFPDITTVLYARLDLFLRRLVSVTPGTNGFGQVDCDTFYAEQNPVRHYVRNFNTNPNGLCRYNCVPMRGRWITETRIIFTFNIAESGFVDFSHIWYQDYVVPDCDAPIFGLTYINAETITCNCFRNHVGCPTEYSVDSLAETHICHSQLSFQAVNNFTYDLLLPGEPVVDDEPYFFYMDRLTVSIVIDNPVGDPNDFADGYDWLLLQTNISCYIDYFFPGYEDSYFCNFQIDSCRIPTSRIDNTLLLCHTGSGRPGLWAVEQLLQDTRTDYNLPRNNSYVGIRFESPDYNVEIKEFSGCPTREMCDENVVGDCICYGDGSDINDIVNPCGVNCRPGGPNNCVPPTYNELQLDSKRITVTFTRNFTDLVCQ